MTTKTFPTLDVIGAHSGILLVEGHFDGIQQVCEHVAGRGIMTHQMGTRGKGSGVVASLERQHPWLADLSVPTASTVRTPEMGDAEFRAAYAAAVNRFAATIFDEHGATLSVATDPAFEEFSPLDDLPEGTPTIVIQIPGE